MAKRRYLDGQYDSLEEAVIDWQCMAPVGSQLQRPVGRGYADEFVAQCRACAEEIVDRDLRGRVEELAPTALSVFALGICRQCSCITPYQLIIREMHGDLVVQTKGQDGEWNEIADGKYEPGMRRLMENLRQFVPGDQ